jgi:Reverse transcriptase (RNA-dependent DNA polymerase)
MVLARESTKHIRKPTQHVKDILEGIAESSKLPPGVQLPTQPQDNEDIPVEKPSTVLKGEGPSDWMMVGEEYAMVADISNVEALEPWNLAEAKVRPDWLLWEKAIHEELSVLKATGTWELVDAPKGVNIVGSKWVFRAKKDAAGIVVRYKARLVAQGFSQVPGIDYFDTFAPVARLSSIRAVLSIAAVNDYEIHQIDIKGAYLNGILTSDETIFMKQPPGYRVGSPEQVCRLRKTLYGLKQSGRHWYQRLVEIMVTHLGLSTRPFSFDKVERN